MEGYDYPKIIKEQCSALPEVVGKTLNKVLVQVVRPEFNVVFLVFEDACYAINGRIGTEIIGIARIDSPPVEGMESSMTITKPFKPYDLFLDRRVSQVRMIGEAWNGHGFEFSFEALPNRTLIIQSIYAGSWNDQELHDCLRLGIGYYHLNDEAV
jgi:hypothetical protein